jgi:hypothetical protein
VIEVFVGAWVVYYYTFYTHSLACFFLTFTTIGMDLDVIFDEYNLENLYKFLSSRDPSTPYIVTAERYFVATDNFKDGQILEDFSTCKRFP